MSTKFDRSAKASRLSIFAMGGLSIRLAMIIVGVLSTGVLVTSLASYSSTAAPADSHFDTGTVQLTASPSSAMFNATGMKPGDVVYAPLTLANAGSLALNYTMATAATNTDSKNLAAALQAEVRKVASTTCNATTFGASSTTMASNVTGIASLAMSSRALAVGANEIACFQVTLPSSAANSVQGASTDVTFTFTGAQS
jgi:hypothetical protein